MGRAIMDTTPRVEWALFTTDYLARNMVFVSNPVWRQLCNMLWHFRGSMVLVCPKYSSPIKSDNATIKKYQVKCKLRNSNRQCHGHF